MRSARFAKVYPPKPVCVLPARIELIEARSGPVLLLLLLPVATLALLPFALVFAHLVSDPAAIDGLLARPLKAFQLGLAFTLLACGLGVALDRAFMAMGRSRTIEIVDGLVRVTDRGPVARTTWSAPLAAYDGLTRRIRATLAGTRHELVLVHPDRKLSLLIGFAPSVSDGVVSAAAAALGVPAIAPSDVGARRPVMAPAQPGPFPQPA